MLVSPSFQKFVGFLKEKLFLITGNIARPVGRKIEEFLQIKESNKDKLLIKWIYINIIPILILMYFPIARTYDFFLRSITIFMTIQFANYFFFRRYKRVYMTTITLNFLGFISISEYSILYAILSIASLILY